MGRMSLKVKLIAVMFALGLAGSLALGLNVYLELKSMEEAKLSVAESASEQVTALIDRNLFERYGDAQAFAASDAAKSGDPARVEAFMNTMMGIYAPVYDTMLYVDGKGRVIAANTVKKDGAPVNSSALVGGNVANEPWFQQVSSGQVKPGQTLVQDKYVDKTIGSVFGTDGKVMAFTTPVWQSGKIVGAWRNIMSWQDVVQTIVDEQQKVYATDFGHAEIEIVDADGNRVSTTDAASDAAKFDDLVVVAKLGSPAHRVIDGRFAKYSDEMAEGSTLSTGFGSYPGVGWRIFVSVPTTDATVILARYLALGSGLILLGVFLVGVWIINGTAKSLVTVEADILAATRATRTASSSVDQTSTSLAAAVTEQAAAVQETAASIEQMNAMVKKSAENAELSRQVAVACQQSAERSQSAVDKMLTAMNEINVSNGDVAAQVEASNKKLVEITKVIAEITAKTKVINEIVFQTKLLSFNASVEAARAGEHGKGFAVVAEEVGNLAQMSGKAAQEIGDMLSASTQKVDEIIADTKSRVEAAVGTGRSKVAVGTELARECSAALGDVQRNVTKVGTMASEISTATAETATGLSEINKAVNQIDQVTHANSSASRSLADQGNALVGHADALFAAARSLATAVRGTADVEAGPVSITQPSTPSPQHQARANVTPKATASARSNVSDLSAHRRARTDGQSGVSALKAAAGGELVPTKDDPRFEDI